MLYSFEAIGDGDVSVPEGRDITILKLDGMSYAIDSAFLGLVANAHCSRFRMGQGLRRMQKRAGAGIIC